MDAKSGTNMNRVVDSIVTAAKSSKWYMRIVPGSYLLIEQMMMLMQRNFNFTLYNVLAARIHSECGLREDLVPQAVEFFHQHGQIVHFSREVNSLSSLVVLQPQWLTKVMSSLINARSNWTKNGLLHPSSLPQIWPKQSQATHIELLSILEKFEICIRLTVPRHMTEHPVTTCLRKSGPVKVMSVGSPRPGGTAAASSSSEPTMSPPPLDRSARSVMTIVPHNNPSSSPSLSPRKLKLSLSTTEDQQLDSYLVPMFLPPLCPTDVSKLFTKLCRNSKVCMYYRVFKFEFQPLGFFERLLVRILHVLNSKCTQLWAGGAVLKVDLGRRSSGGGSGSNSSSNSSRDVAGEEELHNAFREAGTRYTSESRSSEEGMQRQADENDMCIVMYEKSVHRLIIVSAILDAPNASGNGYGKHFLFNAVTNSIMDLLKG